MAMFALVMCGLLFAGMIAWLVWCGMHCDQTASYDPKRNIRVIDEVEGIVLAATRCREFQEARAERLLELHGYKYGSCEADLLLSVIYDGMKYTEAMESIMRLKRNRKLNDAAAIDAEEDVPDGKK